MQEKKNSTKAFDGFIRFLTAEEIRANLKEAQQKLPKLKHKEETKIKAR